MKKGVFAITILSLWAAAGAQSPLGLHYPLGVPDFAVTGPAAAMGGGGTAVDDEYFGTSLNPANAAIGARAAFSALVSFDVTTVENDGSSDKVSGYSPKLLSLIVPLGGAGNLSFAMQRRYDGNINFFTTAVLREDHIGYRTGTIELQKRGGLTAWQGGWAYRFGNGLSLGLMYERLFYNMDSREIFEAVSVYDPDSGRFTFRGSATNAVVTKFTSNGIRFGAQIPVHESVMLGAAVEYILSGSDNGTAEYEFRRSDATVPLGKSYKTFSVDMPSSFNIGVAYRPNERWLFAADGYTTLWDTYRHSIESSDAVRTYGLSAGARLVPGANRLSTPYWEKVLYSAGMRYTTLPAPESGAHEYSFSLGTGLPIPNEGGVVDLVVGLGKRTDSRFEKYAENIVRFQLGISGGRSWFQNRERQ